MIKFYTSQELARRFDIRLSRWKRWSREFLPPDPLGGLQSGYARQYNLDQAFCVYMGGYLVAALKFTIPESRLILKDLQHWLAEKGFYFNFSSRAPAGWESRRVEAYYQIAIGRAAAGATSASGFFYCPISVAADKRINTNGRGMQWVQSVEEVINAEAQDVSLHAVRGYRVLNISILHHTFLKALDIDPAA